MSQPTINPAANPPTTRASLPGRDRSGPPDRLLRQAFWGDAGISGTAGLLCLAVGSAFYDQLGIPVGARWPLGLFLVLYASLLALLARSATIDRTQAKTMIIGNFLWSSASVALVIGGWLPLTGLGVATVLFQAGVVAGLAAIQLTGLRRLRRTTPA